MPPTRLPSDLVRDPKIEAEVLGTETKHVFFAPGKSAKERQVRKEEIWVREECLGQGAFGIVHRERCQEGERRDKVRAVKEIKKRVAAGEELDYTRELEAIVKFSNPRYSHCFVSSDGWYETEASVFISMEYLELRDLQRYLTQPLHESDAREITAQVLEGLQIMHENDFVHRDLKPGNIMVVAKRPWFVKIADFGISKRRLDDVTSLRTLQRGTFGFAAPEIFGLGPGADTGSYTTAVDMWSLGAVVHKILTGSPPFQGLAEVFKYINGTTEFPLTDLKQRGISEKGQDFISSLMAQDPKDRLTSDSAAKHPWMTTHLDSPETDTIKPTSETHFDQITITTASGCWTPDHTVPKPPILTQMATPPLSNYRPPSIDDCPMESDVDPRNCLPKDSTVLLEVSGVSPEDDPPLLADDIRLSPESGNPGAPPIDTPADMAPRALTTLSPTKPGHLTAAHDTASASKTSVIEPAIDSEKRFDKFSEITSRYPRVASAYKALLVAIDELDDPDTRSSLQQALSSNLLGKENASSFPESSDDETSMGSQVMSQRPYFSEMWEPCMACGVDVSIFNSAVLPCRHRICYSCLERRLKSLIEDTGIKKPLSCRCGGVIPLRYADGVVDDEVGKVWNRVFKETTEPRGVPQSPNTLVGRPQAGHKEASAGEMDAELLEYLLSPTAVKTTPLKDKLGQTSTSARKEFNPKSKERLEYLGRQDGDQPPYAIRSRLYDEAEPYSYDDSEEWREPTDRGLSEENDSYPRTMHLERPRPWGTRRTVNLSGDGSAPRRHISFRPESRPTRQSDEIEQTYQPLTVGALALHQLMNHRPEDNWRVRSPPSDVRVVHLGKFKKR